MANALRALTIAPRLLCFDKYDVPDMNTKVDDNVSCLSWSQMVTSTLCIKCEKV